MSVIVHMVCEFLSTPRIGVAKKRLRKEFERTAGVKISRRHFDRLLRYLAKKKITTGMADCRLVDIPQIQVDRVMFEIFCQNVISIDEKPWGTEKITPHTYWVLKGEHVGGIWKPLHKLLKGAPVYMISAIAVG
jgi:hypothetical protein